MPEITRQFSAGGVVYKRVKDKKVLWLVSKSRPSRLYPESVWRFPKGWIDDKRGGKKPGELASGKKRAKEEDLRKTAIREVKEEAGVEAKIIEKIGTERYFLTISNQRTLKFVTFYLMKWSKDLASGFGPETSEIKWLPFEEARKKLSYSGEKKILDKGREILKSGIQETLV